MSIIVKIVDSVHSVIALHAVLKAVGKGA